MKRLNNIYICAVVVVTICLCLCAMFYDTCSISSRKNVQLVVDMTATAQADYELYYTGTEQTGGSEQKSVSNVRAGEQSLKFTINAMTRKASLHFGNVGAVIDVTGAYLEYKGEHINLPLENLFDLNTSYGVRTLDSYYDGSRWHLEVENVDSMIAVNIADTDIIQTIQSVDSRMYLIFKAVICLLFVAAGVMFLTQGKKIQAYIYDIYKNRKLILSLAKNDFKTKYAGSYLGIFWAFVQPIITIMVYWFVFSVGLRQGAIGKVPYALWLVSGLVPWFFFSDALVGGTNALIEYNYLVKKVVFNINILPVVKVLSAGVVHVFFVVFTVLLYTVLGYFPGMYFLQLLYYSICIFVLSLAIVYVTSSVVVFFRDLTQVINIVLQVGIWMTPIMWQINIVPRGIRWIFYLNPFYYIVNGFRDSMIDKVLIIDRWGQGIYFWSVVCILFILGTRLFKRLQVHFADVL